MRPSLGPTEANSKLRLALAATRHGESPEMGYLLDSGNATILWLRTGPIGATSGPALRRLLWRRLGCAVQRAVAVAFAPRNVARRLFGWCDRPHAFQRPVATSPAATTTTRSGHLSEVGTPFHSIQSISPFCCRYARHPSPPAGSAWSPERLGQRLLNPPTLAPPTNCS